MKIIILIALILFSSTFAFSNEADNLIKQQKENKRKELEAEEKRKKLEAVERKKVLEVIEKIERNEKAMVQCRDKVAYIVALKIKELMDKGVKFKKPRFHNIRDIGGKKYEVYSNGRRDPVYTMYEDRFIVKHAQNDESPLLGTHLTSKAWMYLQPENGDTVSMVLEFKTKRSSVNFKAIYDYFDIPAGEWNFDNLAGRGARRIIEFKSFRDLDEIEKKRDRINDAVVKAIEVAVKYGDK